MANNGNLVSLLFLGDALPIDEDFLEEIAKDFKSDCSMAFTRRKVEEEVRKEDESEDKEASTNTNETELPNRPPFERVLQKLKHMIDAEKSDESSHSESVDHIDKQEGTEIDVQDNTQGETKEDKVHKILLLCFAETPDELIKLKKETPLLTVVLLTPKAQKKRRPSITSLKISKDTSASSLFHSSLITSVRKWVIEGKMFRDIPVIELQFQSSSGKQKNPQLISMDLSDTINSIVNCKKTYTEWTSSVQINPIPPSPTANAQEVLFRRYMKLSSHLPASISSVPIILDCMLEAVISSADVLLDKSEPRAGVQDTRSIDHSAIPSLDKKDIEDILDSSFFQLQSPLSARSGRSTARTRTSVNAEYKGSPLLRVFHVGDDGEFRRALGSEDFVVLGRSVADVELSVMHHVPIPQPPSVSKDEEIRVGILNTEAESVAKTAIALSERIRLCREAEAFMEQNHPTASQNGKDSQLVQNKGITSRSMWFGCFTHRDIYEELTNEQLRWILLNLSLVPEVQVLHKFDERSDQLLLLAHTSIPRGRKCTKRLAPIERYAVLPSFSAFFGNYAAKAPSRASTPLQNCLPEELPKTLPPVVSSLTEFDLESIAKRQFLLYPADGSVISVERPSGVGLFGGSVSGPRVIVWSEAYTFGIQAHRADNTLHNDKSRSETQEILNKRQSEGKDVDTKVESLEAWIFVCTCPDGTVLRITNGADPSKKPDGFGTVWVTIGFVDGLVIQAKSEGIIVQTRIEGDSLQEIKSTSWTIFDQGIVFYQPNSTVKSHNLSEIRFPNGTTAKSCTENCVDVVDANGERIRVHKTGKHIDCTAQSPLPANQQKDPITSSLVIRRSDGQTMLLEGVAAETGDLSQIWPNRKHETEDYRVVVYHTDTTQVVTDLSKRCFQFDGPGLAKVEIDIVAEMNAQEHAAGRPLPLLSSGSVARMTAWLPDGTFVQLKYDTRVTSRVNGRIEVTRTDGTKIVALDSGKVTFIPGGIAREYIRKHAASAKEENSPNASLPVDSGIIPGTFVFNIHEASLMTLDPENNNFSMKLRSDGEVDVNVDLAGQLHGVTDIDSDDGAEATGPPITNPVPPRLIVVRRDGSAREWLSEEAVKRLALELNTVGVESTSLEESLGLHGRIEDLLVQNCPMVSLFRYRPSPQLVQPKIENISFPPLLAPDSFVASSSLIPTSQILGMRLLTRTDPVTQVDLSCVQKDLQRLNELHLSQAQHEEHFDVEDKRDVEIIQQEQELVMKVVAMMQDDDEKRKLEQEKRKRKEKEKENQAQNGKSDSKDKKNSELRPSPPEKTISTKNRSTTRASVVKLYEAPVKVVETEETIMERKQQEELVERRKRARQVQKNLYGTGAFWKLQSEGKVSDALPIHTPEPKDEVLFTQKHDILSMQTQIVLHYTSPMSLENLPRTVFNVKNATNKALRYRTRVVPPTVEAQTISNETVILDMSSMLQVVHGTKAIPSDEECSLRLEAMAPLPPLRAQDGTQTLVAYVRIISEHDSIDIPVFVVA